MKSETSPLGNPVSACGAGDAGVENVPYGFDPIGVAQQQYKYIIKVRRL